jgi:hypothetical protein
MTTSGTPLSPKLFLFGAQTLVRNDILANVFVCGKWPNIKDKFVEHESSTWVSLLSVTKKYFWHL